MARALTMREHEVLRVMVSRAGDRTMPDPIDPDQRQYWLTQIPTTRAGRSCACGMCPTIDLEDESGHTPPAAASRIVLSASVPGALLLLFIDDNRLSSLELAPTDPDSRFAEFPPADSLQFA